jgi:GT2 family glycosyltransferase
MDKINIKLSIIIVSYNVKDKITKCISSLIKINNCEIIIIDNNSSDRSHYHLSKNFLNKAIIVKNHVNFGFAKAVNQGIKLSKGKYILLINPDTLPSPKSINMLLLFLEGKGDKTGLVGGRMIKPESGLTHGTCVDTPTLLTGIFEFTNLKKIFPNNKFSKDFYFVSRVKSDPLLVTGLSGGFLMFKSSLIEDVGYLDENFFMYLEDIDYGIRARNKGYLNYYIPEAKIVHDSGSSSKTSRYKINVKAWRDSRNYFFKKHLNSIEGFILNILFKLDDLIVDSFHRLKGEPLS